LEDQNVLAEVAKNDSDWRVREAAVVRLEDQSTLAEVAINVANWRIHKAAAQKLKDQNTLDPDMKKALANSIRLNREKEIESAVKKHIEQLNDEDKDRVIGAANKLKEIYQSNEFLLKLKSLSLGRKEKY